MVEALITSLCGKSMPLSCHRLIFLSLRRRNELVQAVLWQKVGVQLWSRAIGKLIGQNVAGARGLSSMAGQNVSQIHEDLGGLAA